MFAAFFGGASKEDERLDHVQAVLAERSEDVGEEHLDLIAEAAKDLCGIMDAVVAKGAKSAKQIRRVEELSDVVLKNLEQRVTLELLRAPGSEAIVDRLRAVAVDLDKVRVTKASARLDSHVDILQEQLAAEALKAVDAASALVKEVPKDLSTLVPTFQKVLSSIAQTHSVAPRSTKLTDVLLKRLGVLATQLMKLLPPALNANPAIAAAARDLSEELDELAGKLVVVMGATWDPPATPQIDSLVKTQVAQAFVTQLRLIEAETAKGPDMSREVVAQALAALQPWWPVSHTVADCSARLQALCEEADRCAVAAFERAVAAGDVAETEVWFKFAEHMDTATASFDGIPIADSSLRAKLMSDSASVSLPKRLEALDAAFAKDGELDTAETVLALQTMEILVPLWKPAVGENPDLLSQLGTTLDAVERRVEGAMASAPLPKVMAFMTKFAVKYDERCAALDLEGRGLRSKLAPAAARAVLQVAEAELAKTEGMNPKAVLEALESLRDPLLKATLTEYVAVSASAGKVHDTIAERLQTALQEALAVDDKRKVGGLMKFASSCDAALADLGLRADLEDIGTAGLERARLRAGEPIGSVPKRLDALRELFTADGEGADLELATTNTVLQTMQHLVPLWKPAVAEGPELLSHLATTLDAVEGRVESATATAPLAKALAFATRFAARYEELCGALGLEGRELRQKLAPLAVPVVLQAIEEELAKTEGMNPMVVLKAFESLREPQLKAALSEESVTTSAQQARDTIAARLQTSLQENLAADNKAKVENLLKFSSSCDVVFADLGLGADLQERLQRLSEGSAAAKTALQSAEEELAKTEGMNPVVVLKALEGLRDPMPKEAWEGHLSAKDNVWTRATAVRDTIAARLQASLRDALAADNKKKVDSLLKFASSCDAVLADLSLTAGLEDRLQRISDGDEVEEF